MNWNLQHMRKLSQSLSTEELQRQVNKYNKWSMACEVLGTQVTISWGGAKVVQWGFYSLLSVWLLSLNYSDKLVMWGHNKLWKLVLKYFLEQIIHIFLLLHIFFYYYIYNPNKYVSLTLWTNFVIPNIWLRPSLKSRISFKIDQYEENCLQLTAKGCTHDRSVPKELCVQ